ncbi:MAG TPA: DUF488 domain-containing protein [Chthoniobacteraceae bacterium]|nr:DUF488 domain-containing protein [Chthoniobacteraceae bacterium]
MKKTQTTETIWTIGHSTRGIEEFIGLLKAHRIETLADVRHFPGSKRYPHFGKEALAGALRGAGIDYQHFPELGGRRKVLADSHNTAWRNEAFRGYADYMETPEFAAGIARLREVASHSRTAIMCAEAVWWRCHRSLIADWLKAEGVQVLHIMDARKAEPHPYTGAARIEQGRLTYRELL